MYDKTHLLLPSLSTHFVNYVVIIRNLFGKKGVFYYSQFTSNKGQSRFLHITYCHNMNHGLSVVVKSNFLLN